MLTIPQHVRDKIIAYYEADLNTSPNLSGMEVTDFRVSKNGEVWKNPYGSPLRHSLILEKKQWRPEWQAPYFFIGTDLEVKRELWANLIMDRARLEVGNVFTSREEAQVATDAVKSALKGLPR